MISKLGVASGLIVGQAFEYKPKLLTFLHSGVLYVQSDYELGKWKAVPDTHLIYFNLILYTCSLISSQSSQTQSHDQCVKSCGRQSPGPLIFCLRVSNPTTHLTFVNIELEFDIPTMNTSNATSANPTSGGVRQDVDIIFSLGLGWIMWICFELAFPNRYW